MQGNICQPLKMHIQHANGDGLDDLVLSQLDAERWDGGHPTAQYLQFLISNGDGWHNNHHAFPTSARHGLRWWQIDTSWMVIRTMQILGLAWNVKLPSDEALAAKQH